MSIYLRRFASRAVVVPVLAILGAAFAADRAVAQLPAPTNVFTNRMNSPTLGGVNQGFGNRAATFEIATNGIIPAAQFVDQWDTCCDFNGTLTDFAGLYYGAPITLDTVTVHTFNNQFFDGGDWEAQPKLYILRKNVDTGVVRPEASPYWEEVTGFTETTGHVFNTLSNQVQGPEMFSFDLSSLSADARTGYGWAVGGVDGIAAVGNPAVQNFVTVTELQATGSAAASVPEFTIPATSPTSIFSNSYNSVHANGTNHGYDRVLAFEIATNGVVNHGGGGQVDGFDTFGSDSATSVLTDFVGLRYDQSVRFDTITVEMGNHFGDGGAFVELPKVYILKNPVLDTDSVRPEISPNWVEVPGAVLASAITFSDFASGGNQAGGTITLDLSAIPDLDRTGWGWAIGGVDGTRHPDVDRQRFISVSELSATGEAASIPLPPLPATPQAINVVGNAYGSPRHKGDDLSGGRRGEIFESITNGVIQQSGSAYDGYDTCCDDAGVVNDFVGLHYNSQVRFDEISIYLGNQFGDGGDWDSMPRIFILKNPVDTNQLAPEDDPANWLEITGYSETTGHIYSSLVAAGAGGSMTFDLSAVDAALRTGWGWAVGGVDGNSNGSGVRNFITVTEVDAQGIVVPEPSSLAISALSILGLAMFRRRRSTRS